MSRTHDLGGRRGFGDIPVDDGHDFHEAWEARIFGIVRALRQNGVCTSDEWRHCIERLPPDVYLNNRYFHRWLLAAERIVVEKGVLAPGQLDELAPPVPGRETRFTDDWDAGHG